MKGLPQRDQSSLALLTPMRSLFLPLLSNNCSSQLPPLYLPCVLCILCLVDAKTGTESERERERTERETKASEWGWKTRAGKEKLEWPKRERENLLRANSRTKESPVTYSIANFISRLSGSLALERSTWVTWMKIDGRPWQEVLNRLPVDIQSTEQEVQGRIRRVTSCLGGHFAVFLFLFPLFLLVFWQKWALHFTLRAPSPSPFPLLHHNCHEDDYLYFCTSSNIDHGHTHRHRQQTRLSCSSFQI